MPLGKNSSDAVQAASEQLHLRPQDILNAGVHKLSVDARRGKPVLVYTIALELLQERAAAYIGRPGLQIKQDQPLILQHGFAEMQHRPIICGLGPAGLFAAYLLAREGYCPLVLERGPCIEERVRAVEDFQTQGRLNEQANIQFGEGGAGTFSDGKLTTRIHDPLCSFVTQVLLENGAPTEIALRQKPHIGTDLLRNVIISIRKKIEAWGGEVSFETQLTGLEQQGGKLCGIKTSRGTIPCETLILAPGHSARDTFDMLMQQGIALECKPFSVGFRAEHLQSTIENALYHEAAGHPDLPCGEYQLSTHIGKRGVYTFCMCPGGQVVAAASEKNTVVTNGMSYHARNGKNANAAVVVSVDPQDFQNDPVKAIEFQRALEHRAFELGGAHYQAPAQNITSFLEEKPMLRVSSVEPTYPLGVQAGELGGLFGQELSDALRAGLRDFGRKMPGYTGADAILTGVETRTSSPVRLPRQEDFQSAALKGLYPAGEGAGYAGGIMSAAVDGIRAARAVIERFSPCEKEL